MGLWSKIFGRDRSSAESHKITVLGTGAFGGSVGLNEAMFGNDVMIWGRNPQQVDAINSGQLPGLGGHSFSRKGLKFEGTNDLGRALAHSDIVLIGIASRGLVEVLPHLHPDKQKIMVSLIKSMIPDSDSATGYSTPTEMMRKQFGADHKIGVVAGLAFAKDVAEKKPVHMDVASDEFAIAQQLQATLETSSIKLTPHNDPIGLELGVVAKTAHSIGAGILAGHYSKELFELPFTDGHPIFSTLIAQVHFEISQIVAEASPYEFSFFTFGLAGHRDLVGSVDPENKGRNYQFGVGLGKGGSVGELIQGVTLEGIMAAQGVQQIARFHGVETPVLDAIVDIIMEKVPPEERFQRMVRSLRFGSWRGFGPATFGWQALVEAVRIAEAPNESGATSSN